MISKGLYKTVIGELPVVAEATGDAHSPQKKKSQNPRKGVGAAAWQRVSGGHLQQMGEATDAPEWHRNIGAEVACSVRREIVRIGAR